VSPTEKTDARAPGSAADQGAGSQEPSAPGAGSPAASASRPAGQASSAGSTSAGPPGGVAGGPRPAAAPGGAAAPAAAPRTPVSASSTTRQPLVSPARPTAPASRPAGAGAAAATRPVARPAAASAAAPKPADSAAPAAATPPSASEAPRRVRLSLSRVNLWSVARLAFLLSVALGIIGVVVVTLLWAILNTMGVFTQLDSVISDVVGTESDFRLADLLSLPRVLSVTVFLAVVDVVLVTLVTTIAALLYNLASGLVGGIRLTLSDD